jgi:hypothetical protein
MATTDTDRAGVGSSTTVDVCDGAVPDGNKCQHIALFVAPGQSHARKPNSQIGCSLTG